VKDGPVRLRSFGVHNREPRVWTTGEIALVQDVADRLWATLELPQGLKPRLRANEDRLDFLLRLNDALRPLSDPGDVQRRRTAARTTPRRHRGRLCGIRGDEYSHPARVRPRGSRRSPAAAWISRLAAN
jgi:GAF domain-containing protein